MSLCSCLVVIIGAVHGLWHLHEILTAAHMELLKVEGRTHKVNILSRSVDNGKRDGGDRQGSLMCP